MSAPHVSRSDSDESLRFHHFEVLRSPDGEPLILGRGAYATTYRAFDTVLRRPVALKVVDFGLLPDLQLRGRMVEEARNAAAVKHPNLAAVYYFGEEGDACFYAMELVDGQSLEDYIKSQGALPPRYALEVGAQIAAALGAAHDAGVVHCDVKPANIMLASGPDGGLAVKLVDFGLAFARAAESCAEASDSFCGTPLYSSPEQLDGVQPDTRSDVYSLGATIFFMLGGRPPFAGATIAELAQKHAMQDVPVHWLAGVPIDVSSLVLRFMAKEQGARPADGAESRAEIEEILRRYRHSADRTACEWMQGRFAQVEQAGLLEGGILYKAAQTRGSEELAVFHFDNSSRGLVSADRMRIAVPMVRAIKSSSARRIIDMADTSDGLVVVCEWMSGTRLLSVLRVRRSLPSEEARVVLLPVAQALDEAAAAGLALPHVGLRDVLLQPLGDAGQRLTQWQDLRVAVDLLPLAEAREFDINATVVGRSLALAGCFAYAASGQNAASIIASLAYEILGGTTAPRAGFYVPLPELSENANRILRRVFEGGVTGMSASALVDRLLGEGELSADWHEETAESAQQKRKPAPALRVASSPEATPLVRGLKSQRRNILVGSSFVIGALIFAAAAYFAAQSYRTEPGYGSPPASGQMPTAEGPDPTNASAADTAMVDFMVEADEVGKAAPPLDAPASSETGLAASPSDPAIGASNQIAFRPGSLLGITDLQLRDSFDDNSPTKELRFTVQARTGESIDPHQVRVNVTFYDNNGSQIVRTMSHVRSVWLTPPVDWESDGRETLEVICDVLRFGPRGGPPPGVYFGYVVDLYYRGELQETRAEPADLKELFRPTSLDANQTAQEAAPRQYPGDQRSDLLRREETEKRQYKNWLITRLGGRDYIPLWQVAIFYRMDVSAAVDRRISLISDTRSMEFYESSREAVIDGVKNWLSFPILSYGGALYVARMDLAKTIDPLMRPDKIPGLQPVRHILLDPGAAGGNSKEETYNLEIALEIQKILTGSGLAVSLTREDNRPVPVEQRLALAEQLGEGTVFVGIDCGGSVPSSSTDADYQVYALTPRGAPNSADNFLTARSFSRESGHRFDHANQALAASIYHAILGRMPAADGGKEGGIKRAKFPELSGAVTPAALVKCGPLPRSPDARLLENVQWRSRLADSIARGILEYVNLTRAKAPPKLFPQYRKTPDENSPPSPPASFPVAE